MKFLNKFLKEDIEIITEPFNKDEFRNRLFIAVIREFRLKYIFRKLLVVWRSYKMICKTDSEPDPITLLKPEKEVHIFDWQMRKRFVLDAKSLANYIESKLLYFEYGFSVPIFPKNPRNNVPFTYSQLVSIYYQLQKYGELKWGLVTMRQYNFNQHKWQMYNKSALTIKAITNSIIDLDTPDGRELLEDFIFSKMDELGELVNPRITEIYKKAMIHAPKHWYIERFKYLAILHYEGEHFGQKRNRIINTACEKLLDKQPQFIKELQTKNIIHQ
jgi:hypothetical protein